MVTRPDPLRDRPAATGDLGPIFGFALDSGPIIEQSEEGRLGRPRGFMIEQGEAP